MEVDTGTLTAILAERDQLRQAEQKRRQRGRHRVPKPGLQQRGMDGLPRAVDTWKAAGRLGAMTDLADVIRETADRNQDASPDHLRLAVLDAVIETVRAASEVYYARGVPAAWIE